MPQQKVWIFKYKESSTNQNPTIFHSNYPEIKKADQAGNKKKTLILEIKKSYMIGTLVEISGQNRSTKLLRCKSAWCFKVGWGSLSIASNPPAELTIAAAIDVETLIETLQESNSGDEHETSYQRSNSYIDMCGSKKTIAFLYYFVFF